MMLMVAQQNGDQIAKSSIRNSSKLNRENVTFHNLSRMSTIQQQQKPQTARQLQLETINQRQPNQSIFKPKLAHFQLAANGGRRLQLLLFFLLCSCIGAFEPDFVIPLENVTVSQGRDATFTCVVNNLGGHRVSADGASGPAKVAWIKADAKAILAIHEHVITNNDRLSVTHNDYNTWTLNIRSVKMEDAGKYMCQVNTDPMKMQTAVLEVVIPPDIVNEETSGDMMVPEGGSAKLICRARGHPQPRITWRREDGRDIIARNGSHHKTKALSVEGEMLTLAKVTRSEMGAYMCIASNGVPPTVSKRMKLQVHFHPLVQVPNQLVGAPVQTDVTLICNVEASPKAINYWQRENGEMIIVGERYGLTEKEHNMYSIEMILQIRRLQTSDFGGYKCISKNSIGDTEGTIRLYEMDRPGKKNYREYELNEVMKSEVAPKDNRTENGTRNQNGRLYKERNQVPDVVSGAQSMNGPGTMPIIGYFVVFVLLTTKLCCNTKRNSQAICTMQDKESTVGRSKAMIKGADEPLPTVEQQPPQKALKILASLNCNDKNALEADNNNNNTHTWPKKTTKIMPGKQGG